METEMKMSKKTRKITKKKVSKLVDEEEQEEPTKSSDIGFEKTSDEESLQIIKEADIKEAKVVDADVEPETKVLDTDLEPEIMVIDADVASEVKSDIVNENNDEDGDTDADSNSQLDSDSETEDGVQKEEVELDEDEIEVSEMPAVEQPVWKTLYTYCERCKDYVYAYYQEKMITEATSFPVYMVWVHGRPLHGLLLRIDRNFTSRGERIVNIEFDMQSLQPSE